MDENQVEKKLRSAKKGIEWMEISKPSVAARTDKQAASGDALGPAGLEMGSELLSDWCKEHQT